MSAASRRNDRWSRRRRPHRSSDPGAAGPPDQILRTRIDGFYNGHVRHPRSRAWLQANDDNPFRTWADDAAELAQHASTHWRRAKARLRQATTTAGRESAIQNLADNLDRLADE